MTDSPEEHPKQGPPNPQAEGVEAPTPPGGPLRQDAAGAPSRPGHDDDASASPANDKHASESGGHTIPLEDEQPGPSGAEGEEESEEAARSGDTLQFENAETSLDQPSEG